MRARSVAAILIGLAGLAPAPVGASGEDITLLPPPAPDELLPPTLSPVTRAYQEPPNVYSAGHRGVDLKVENGITVLTAPVGGTVDTGVVVDNRYISIEQSQLRVTLSYVAAALVLDGTSVRAGAAVARAGAGHPGQTPVHVHLSVRIPDLLADGGWRYVDPMPYLRRYLRRVRTPVAHALPTLVV